MIDRRNLLQKASALGISATLADQSCNAALGQVNTGIVDTNVSLFHWPFRRLPLDKTDKLVRKLQSLGVSEAWAGSLEGLLHRDIEAVNQRLAAECKHHPMLVPIGSINLKMPSWEKDLRACFNGHNMPGIRLHPNYHGYLLDDVRFRRLLELSAKAKRFVQIVVAMEDERTQNSQLLVKDVDLNALAKIMGEVKNVKIQILNAKFSTAMSVNFSGACVDTARIDSTDGVPRIVKKLSQSRVLYGSHAPLLIPEAAIIRTHESSGLDDESLRYVLGKNADNIRGLTNSKKRRFVNLRPGLPTEQHLARYRIWDAYFTPSHSHPGRNGYQRLIDDIDRSLPAIRKAGFEKLCYFAHVGVGTTSDSELEELLKTNPKIVSKPLDQFPELLLGMIQVNANDVDRSLDAINRWIQDGPMKGVYFAGSGPGALCCTHRNFDALIKRVVDLKGVIMQHTWFNSLGKQHPGGSTPVDLATLARRYPEQKFICAHAGGEWQRGIRAVREVNNIFVETSGFDATSGFIEMAVREIGAKRVVFGSHLPSRSLGTELGKVIGAFITEKEKSLILGENFRRLLDVEPKK